MSMMPIKLTLICIDSHDNNDFVLANLDMLLNRSDSSSGQLGEQNHTLNVVVLKKLDYRKCVLVI